MTLKELLNSLNYGEWILFRDTNDVPQRIEEYSDDWLYNSFIINDDDTDIKEELEEYINEYYWWDDFYTYDDNNNKIEDETPNKGKYVHIYELDIEYIDTDDEEESVKKKLILQKSYLLKPTEEELENIYNG